MTSSPSAIRRGIALLLLLGCALACKAAWKPDGSSFVFPYIVSDDRHALGACDMTTGKVERLAIGDLEGAFRPFYAPDGRLLFLAARAPRSESVKGVLRVHERTAEGSKVLATLEGVDPGATVLGDPVLGPTGALYVSVEDKERSGDSLFLLRLDLATGRSDAPFGTDRSIWLAQGPAGTFYVEPREEKGDGERRTRVTIGRFDPAAEKLTPLAEDIAGEVRWPGISVGEGHLALIVEEGSRLALVTLTPEGKQARFPLDETHGKVTQVVLGPGDEQAYLGVMRPERFELHVLDLGDANGKAPPRRAAVIVEEETTRKFILLTRSPAGSHIAVTQTGFQDADAYLVDLTKEPPSVTKIRVPR